jgi:methyltransferase
MLAVVAVAMALRYWAIATLGERWNTRVICLPETPAVTGGPYRFVRHPNYVAVTLEVAALPLVHSAWITAVVFSAASFFLLRNRIRVEEAALRTHADYDRVLGGQPRFLPRRR